jgi:hypothetical protein
MGAVARLGTVRLRHPGISDPVCTLAILAINVLPYFVGLILRGFFFKSGAVSAWLADFECWGLALPVNLWQLSYYRSGQASVPKDQWVSALVSLVCVSSIACGLWYLVRARFGPVTGRMPG